MTLHSYISANCPRNLSYIHTWQTASSSQLRTAQVNLPLVAVITSALAVYAYLAKFSAHTSINVKLKEVRHSSFYSVLLWHVMCSISFLIIKMLFLIQRRTMSDWSRLSHYVCFNLNVENLANNKTLFLEASSIYNIMPKMCSHTTRVHKLG